MCNNDTTMWKTVASNSLKGGTRGGKGNKANYAPPLFQEHNTKEHIRDDDKEIEKDEC